ncbi:hypothetical protein CD351_02875 [Erythrobacter sp. KY5]|nr:hypothetical protein CD351_02875 [Erythrobacter sp. KY5]
MDIQRDIENYRLSKPSRLGRGIERFTHPFGKTLAGLVPDTVIRAVIKGIDQAVAIPQLMTFDHDVHDIEAAHHAARKVSRAAQGVSASTGAAAGLGGAVSMTADIPATMAIALRTIRDTGRAFGFDGEGPEEKIFRLQILELATLDDPDVRRDRIADLEAQIDPNGHLKSAKGDDIFGVVDQAVERISRALAFAAFRSRAGMLVPVAGSIVGGLVNSSFQADIGKAARFAFQVRALKRAEMIEG